MYRTRPDTTARTRATLLVTFLVLIIIAQFMLFLAVYHPQHPVCTTGDTKSPHLASPALSLAVHAKASVGLTAN